MIENSHQSQHLVGRHRIVDLVVPEQVAQGLDEQELEDTFDDNLFEDTASVVEIRPGVGVPLFGAGWRQGCRNDGISVGLYVQHEEKNSQSLMEFGSPPGVSSMLEPLSSISTLSASSKSWCGVVVLNNFANVEVTRSQREVLSFFTLFSSNCCKHEVPIRARVSFSTIADSAKPRWYHTRNRTLADTDTEQIQQPVEEPFQRLEVESVQIYQIAESLDHRG